MDPQAKKVATGAAAIIEGADTVVGVGQLQSEIMALVNLEYYEANTAAWVTKVSGAPTEVIAGAIAMWVPRPVSQGPGEGVMYVGANEYLAPRREAAMAILQARFAKAAGRQTRWLIGLTWVIAALTLVLAFITVKPLLTPIPTHAVVAPMPKPK
jgi:hypothetical protein